MTFLEKHLWLFTGSLLSEIDWILYPAFGLLSDIDTFRKNRNFFIKMSFDKTSIHDFFRDSYITKITAMYVCSGSFENNQINNLC
jgi:hypothetical protein